MLLKLSTLVASVATKDYSFLNMPKKTKKKASKSKKAEIQEYKPKPDPIPPQYVPPAPKPMERVCPN